MTSKLTTNIEQLRQQAREKHLAGDTQTAIILLTKAISSNPGNINIALDMVQIFLDTNQLEQAESLFQRLGKKAHKTEMGIAIASQINFKKLANKTQGIQKLQVLILQSPDDYQSHFDLAVCYFAQYNIQQGMEELFIIQQNSPDFLNGAATEMISMVCNMLATNNPEESKRYRRRLSGLLNK